MSFISATLLLFLVMDPFGNIPLFLSLLRHVPKERRLRVLARELVVALVILVFCLFCGSYLIALLQVDQSSVGIAGGVVLFLIALRMIFGGCEEMFSHDANKEPFLVPLAIPYVAGPSTIATVILLMARNEALWPVWLGALLTAWLASSLILVASARLQPLLGERLLTAAERLMGFVLAVIAVDMFMKGIAPFLSGKA